MMKFDPETFLKKVDENDATSAESEDAVAFYEELYRHKKKQRAALKVQLDDFQKKNKALKKKYELTDAFNTELLRNRDFMIQANAVLHQEILEVEEVRSNSISQYVKVMEELEGQYSDFSTLRCDSDSLKAKLAVLKNKKLALQEECNNASEELRSITESMSTLQMPLPNAETVKRIAEEISMQCGDVAAKEQKLEKLKRFLKDFQEKINSN